MSETIEYLKALRKYYGPENKVGMLLDELVKDLEAGAPRAEILEDAAAIKAEIPGSTAAGAIDRAISELG